MIRDGIREARWPGRMERAAENIYLDGAHNPGGSQLLSRQQERSRKEPVKNHGFFLQLCQIKSMRPWQKNFVKVLTGAALVWYI